MCASSAATYARSRSSSGRQASAELTSDDRGVAIASASKAPARGALGGRQRHAMTDVEGQRIGGGHTFAGGKPGQRQFADRPRGRPRGGIGTGKPHLRRKLRIGREVAAGAEPAFT